jgi:hypothetical protein
MNLLMKQKLLSYLLILKRSKLTTYSYILNREKFGEAAEILYEILNNLNVLSERVPIVVACNK